MSRQPKKPAQRARAAAPVRPPHTNPPEATRLMHLLPPMDSLFDDMLTASYRMTVLFERTWSSLDALVRQQTTPARESPERRALDALVRIAAPYVAHQVLQRHIKAHVPVYQEWGLRSMVFHPLPIPDPQAATIRGAPPSTDLVPALRSAITTAAQARAMLPHIPTHVFWPLVGSLFSAVDNSPHVSALTWERIAQHPEGVNSFETDLYKQFRCEPDGHGAGGHWPSLADDRPGVKGPLRRLIPLTPARPSPPLPLSPLP